jgi:hypothetical protein
MEGTIEIRRAIEQVMPAPKAEEFKSKAAFKTAYFRWAGACEQLTMAILGAINTGCTNDGFTDAACLLFSEIQAYKK